MAVICKIKNIKTYFVELLENNSDYTCSYFSSVVGRSREQIRNYIKTIEDLDNRRMLDFIAVNKIKDEENNRYKKLIGKFYYRKD